MSGTCGDSPGAGGQPGQLSERLRNPSQEKDSCSAMVGQGELARQVRLEHRRRSSQPLVVLGARAGVVASSVSRELRRNLDPGSGQYRPVAVELNYRPRKTLGWVSPAELLEELRHAGATDAAGAAARMNPWRISGDAAQNRSQPCPPSSTSPGWSRRCSASWHRYGPRKASTSTTSTAPTWTPCSARSTARWSAATWNCSALLAIPATSRSPGCGWSCRPSSTARPPWPVCYSTKSARVAGQLGCHRLQLHRHRQRTAR